MCTSADRRIDRWHNDLARPVDNKGRLDGYVASCWKTADKRDLNDDESKCSFRTSYTEAIQGLEQQPSAHPPFQQSDCLRARARTTTARCIRSCPFLPSFHTGTAGRMMANGSLTTPPVAQQRQTCNSKSVGKCSVADREWTAEQINRTLPES